MKPIVLQKVGAKWEVYLNMPAALAYGAKGKRMDMYPHDAMVPVVQAGVGKGLDLVPGGKPAKSTKEKASHLAHHIGRYMLGFGDMVFAYTEERRGEARNAAGLTEGVIKITYGAIKNKREGHAWLPMVWEDGRERGDTYAARGYDKDEALRMAERMAQEHASKFVGDWKVTVKRKS